nr:hypothetical protein DA06_20210 [Georgenia sp. SUBG003]
MPPSSVPTGVPDPLPDGPAAPSALSPGAERVGDGDVLEVEDVLAEPGGGEAGELQRVARGRLVGDELGRGVEAELRLGGAGGCAATQPGELLAQEVGALLLGERGGALPLGPCQDVGRVPAVVRLDAAGHRARGRGGPVVARGRPPTRACTPRRGTSGRG